MHLSLLFLLLLLLRLLLIFLFILDILTIIPIITDHLGRSATSKILEMPGNLARAPQKLGFYFVKESM